MRRMDEEGTPRRNRRTSATARRTSGSSERPSLPQDRTRESNLNTSQTTSTNVSTTFNDTFSRLQQIRSALSYLEASMGPANLTGSREQTAPRHSTSSNPEPNIRPSHSAIVLSEENSPVTFDTESLRDRLVEIGPELPEYMHATANMMQNMARVRGSARQFLDFSRSPRTSMFGSRPPEEARTSLPDSRAVEGASEVFDRNSRVIGGSREASTALSFPSNSRDNTSIHSLPAWRMAHRDDDSASTLLGRRVASRAAAARSSGDSPRHQYWRVVPSPSLLRPEYPGPSVVIPRNASRVVIPPRVPDRVSRRIAQFESAADERQRRDDSDGSDTEVNSSYVFRPIRLRRVLDNGQSPRYLRQGRTDSNEQSPTLPDIVPMSPLSSPGGMYSAASSSSGSSPQHTEEEMPAAVSSRMQNAYGHLNRLSNVLSDAPSSAGPTSSSTEGDNLDGALFSRRTDGRQQGDNLYHEVLDEEEGRTYRIRRRINADGDEQVHQINSDAWWDDDSYTNPFFPSSSTAASREARSPTGRDDEQRVFSVFTAATNEGNGNTSVLDRLRRQSSTWNHTTQGQTSEDYLPPFVPGPISIPSTNPDMALRTRRGWSPDLDSNGDEIPSDEEEEIERLRYEQRVRNSQAAWRRANSSSTVRTRLEYLAPTTRSVFSHATDEDEDDENDIRVRLNLPPSGQATRRFANTRFSVLSDVRREKEKELEPEQEYFGTSEPYYISPLPIPLEETIPSGSRRSSHDKITQPGPTSLREKMFAGC